LRLCYNSEDDEQFKQCAEQLRQWCRKNYHNKASASFVFISFGSLSHRFFFSFNLCRKVYKKFETEYERDDRALMWAHGLIQHQLVGGLHQLLPVRTNNLLERIWRVFKYASVMLV
jgi:hypothetical protein